jgi:antirestriction protein
MEEQEPHQQGGALPLPEVPGDPETNSVGTPRIYVASLTDYNNGNLHGAWIDADSDAANIHAGIQTMLSRSPLELAEEFAIFDHDGFAPWRPGEYESIDMVAAVGQGIDEHGPAFAHWAELVESSDPDDLDGFDDAYLGHWRSVEEYAEDLIDGTGVFKVDDVPDSLRHYIQFDYEGFARDMELSGDITSSEGDGGVYIFEGTR